MIDQFGNNVHFVNNFPSKGAVVLNEDGSYDIFIRAQLSHEERVKCYLHELGHIRRGDFFKDDVQEIEHRAHMEDNL